MSWDPILLQDIVTDGDIEEHPELMQGCIFFILFTLAVNQKQQTEVPCIVEMFHK